MPSMPSGLLIGRSFSRCSLEPIMPSEHEEVRLPDLPTSIPTWPTGWQLDATFSNVSREAIEMMIRIGEQDKIHYGEQRARLNAAMDEQLRGTGWSYPMRTQDIILGHWQYRLLVTELLHEEPVV